MNGAIFKRLFIIVLLMAAACSVGLTAYDEERPDRCTPAEGGTLSVHNVKGRIDITAWAGDYVDVRAVKRAGWHASDLEKVRIEIDRGTNVAIRSVYLSKNVDVTVDYTIRIPAAIRLDTVENVTGDIQIIGVSECQAAKTVTGRLVIWSAAGPRRAESVTGNVEVRLSRLDGDAFFKSVTGDIDVYLKPEIEANLDVSMVTGRITNDGLKIWLGDLMSSKHLRGILGAGGPTIRIEVVTGAVNLHRS